MEVLDLMDRLENMAVQAKKMPMSKRSMIDVEELLGLIDQMRVAIPRDLQEAREIMERREQIVSQTMTDARRIRTTAEGDARLLVNETEMVKAAQERGREIIEAANAKAARIVDVAEDEAQRQRMGADEYSKDCLAGLEERVSGMLNEIHAGQRALNPGLSVLR